MMKTMLMAVAAATVAGCAATGAAPAGPMFTGGNVEAVANMAIPGGCPQGAAMASSLTAVCRGVDLVALGLNTSSRPTVNYAETDEFDLALNASMKGQVPTIKAPVGAGERLLASELEAAVRPAPDSPRLAFWLAKIRATGGQNLICEEETDDAESAIAWMLAGMAADWLTDWLTYKPAEEYHALVFVKPVDGGEEWEVTRAEFVRRAATPTPTCP
jgi:hypothetical protein